MYDQAKVLALDYGEFKKWVEHEASVAPERYFYGKHPTCCPLAYFLREASGLKHVHAQVSTTDYQVWDYTEAPLVGNRKGGSMPIWAIGFVNIFDRKVQKDIGRIDVVKQILDHHEATLASHAP